MKWNAQDIKSMDRYFRANLINSITGIKPANLIGTKSKSGVSNLAIFTSVFHMGSNPPLIGMLVRPDKDVRRHTLENIRDQGFYTINHVHHSNVVQAHYTSAKFEAGASEFAGCAFTEEYMAGFEAPFVKESTIKMGLIFREEIQIGLNKTILVIGEIQEIIIEAEGLDENGYINLEASQSIGVSGLNSYYDFKKIRDLPYARIEEIQGFVLSDDQ